VHVEPAQFVATKNASIFHIDYLIIYKVNFVEVKNYHLNTLAWTIGKRKPEETTTSPKSIDTNLKLNTT
jgi:hypothetical protein